MAHAGFSYDVIATLIKGRIVDRDSAAAFLWFVDDGVWRFFHGIAFREVITQCAMFAPDLVLRRRLAIEQHMIEFDPDTNTYHAPGPEARAILRSILLRPLTQLFDELTANSKGGT